VAAFCVVVVAAVGVGVAVVAAFCNVVAPAAVGVAVVAAFCVVTDAADGQIYDLYYGLYCSQVEKQSFCTSY